jgi:hypothetical protein
VADANWCELFVEWTLECIAEPIELVQAIPVGYTGYSTLRNNEGFFFSAFLHVRVAKRRANKGGTTVSRPLRMWGFFAFAEREYFHVQASLKF